MMRKSGKPKPTTNVGARSPDKDTGSRTYVCMYLCMNVNTRSEAAGKSFLVGVGIGI